MQSSIDCEDEHLEFEPKSSHAQNSDAWRIQIKDGDILWSQNWREREIGFKCKTRTITVGEMNGVLLQSKSLPGVGNEKPTTSAFARYRIPSNPGRIELALTAGASDADLKHELSRLTLGLWTVGPLTILVVSLVLSFFIRWQLAPLAQIAHAASRIGPESAESRIGPAGTAAECVALRDALNNMVARLAAGLERERQFASMAAHEFRTPLAQLRTNIEVTLRRERVTDDYKLTLEQSLADVERLQNLVAGLLFLVRRQGAYAESSTVALEEVVSKAMIESGVAAQVEGPVPRVEVRGNIELLYTALKNVLENAKRYAPAAPPILKFTLKDSVIQLAIVDSGPGIAPQDCARIFEPLVRLDQARSIGEDQGGFGLGLAIARAAVRACGGDVRCESNPQGSHGATFVFELLLSISDCKPIS